VPAHTQADLTALLREKGVRPTRQRLELLGELANEPNDVTAQQLWSRLREDAGSPVGLATVYRTLALLREHDVVDALSHHGTELCYRLCSDTHHHHLVCRDCHRVVELDECELDGWVGRLATQHGFTALDHTLEVVGICATCRGGLRPERNAEVTSRQA
jgi:Fur family transcriptional regulator, ferric uptake regulator